MAGAVGSDSLGLRNPKIGLVQGGGGAKGAYQIGVWQALARHGITEFECISGTSVGGLNALLVASSTPKEARNTWMSLANFKKLSNRFATAIALWILFGALSVSPVFLVVLYYSVYRNRFHGDSTVYGPALLMFVVHGVAASMRVLHKTLTHLLSLAGQASLLMLNTYSLVSGFALAFGFILRPFVTSTSVGLIITSETLKIGSISALLVAMSICFWCSFLGLADWLRGRCASMGLLDREQLETIVSERVDAWTREKNQYRCNRVYITVAKEALYYDCEHYTDRASGPFPSPLPWKEEDIRGMWKTEWFPCYVDLLDLSPNDRHRILLDSAALPFAFKNTITKNASYTDGGVVDNLPLAPILAGEKLDLIIAVSLSPYQLPYQTELSKQLDDLWAAHLKGTHLTHNGDSKADMQARYEGMFRSTKPSRYIHETPIIVICPKSRLATMNLPFLSFFTGTLNFEAAVLRLWMRNGYEDACSILGGSPDFLKIVRPAGAG
jgi:predicted acylesterase/phospholipase RssA